MPPAHTAERPPPSGLTPEELTAEVLRDEELMRQVKESLDEERRGESATPFRQVLEEAKRRRSH